MWEFLKTNPEIAKFEKADPNKVSAPILAWYEKTLKENGIPERLWKGFLDICHSGFGLGEMSFAADPPRTRTRTPRGLMPTIRVASTGS